MLSAFIWRYLRRYVAWWVAVGCTLALLTLFTTLFYGLFQPLLAEVLHLDSKKVPALGQMLGGGASAGEKATGGADAARKGLLSVVDRVYRSLKTRFGVDDSNVFVFLPLLLVVLFTLKAMMDAGSTYAFQRIGLGATNDIRNDLFDKLLRQSSRFHAQHPSGELVSRVVNDVSMMQNAVSTGLLDLLQQSVTLASLAAMLLSANLRLALICLVGTPVVLFPIVRFGQSLRRTGRKSQQRLAEVSSLVNEAVRGHRVVKAFGMESFEGQRFRAATKRHLRINLRAQFLASVSSPVVEVIGVAGSAILLVYAGRAIREGSISPDEIFFFLALIGAMYNPVRRLNKANAILQQSLAATQRVMELMYEPEDIREMPHAKALPGLEREIAWENVTFSYDREPVLRDLSLRVPRGEMVAFVGRSGAGKTTIVNLLPRFFDPDSGRITIDGLDIREARLKDLRGLIGLVTQETMLFDDTVRNNIAYGHADLPLARVEAAARAAYAHEFIVDLPQGYETPIGEGGQRLSGGQRQRLAIARALLKDPPILIFDEATSQLDTESEALVQKALQNLMRGRTTLVIAHRLSTVMRADRIIVVESGAIAESGTHAELLEQGGLYRRLHDLQLQEDPPGTDAGPAP